MRFSGPSHLQLALVNAAVLLAAAAAVGLYSVTFPPYFRGACELTPDGRVAGWATHKFEPAERVEVQLYVDGRFVAGGVANLSRPDVVSAGFAADEWCGYSFSLPPLAAGEHEARVYAVHAVGDGAYRTLQLAGSPLRFFTGEGGK
jgi:hypothetical protein